MSDFSLKDKNKLSLKIKGIGIALRGIIESFSFTQPNFFFFSLMWVSGPACAHLD